MRADTVDLLRAGGQQIAPGAVVIFADRYPGFHRVGGYPVYAIGNFGDMIGGFERGVDRRLVAHFEKERLIVRAFVPDRRHSVLTEIGKIGERRQYVEMDFNGLRRVLCLVERFRNDKGDGIPDIADPVADKTRFRRFLN